jgi:hypothetical protein
MSREKSKLARDLIWQSNGFRRRGSHGHGNEQCFERLFALLRQDVTVPVIVVAFYPSPRNRAVYAALEVTVTNFKELVTPEDARYGDIVPCEHCENLPGCVIFCAHDVPDL